MRMLLPVVFGAALLAPERMVAQVVSPPSDSVLTSAVHFVEAFYDWYLADLGSSFRIAIEDSSALFAPALVRGLRADEEAKAQNPGYLVGLEADPFLSSQDPCDTYRVGPARRDGTSILVDVRGDCYRRQDTRADVVAELAKSPSGWVFVNFRYPRLDSDLMTDLAALERIREASRRAAAA